MNVNLRPWRSLDVDALRRLADDPLVARWMDARFPHPYTRADAEGWLAAAVADESPRHFAVEYEGVLAGGAGIEPCAGIHGGVAIVGYWLGREFWGRGIASRVVPLLVEIGASRGFRRLQASVFEPNVASARALEKAGFQREGTLRASVTDRDGMVCDEWIYGSVRQG